MLRQGRSRRRHMGWLRRNCDIATRTAWKIHELTRIFIRLHDEVTSPGLGCWFGLLLYRLAPIGGGWRFGFLLYRLPALLGFRSNAWVLSLVFYGSATKCKGDVNIDLHPTLHNVCSISPTRPWYSFASNALFPLVCSSGFEMRTGPSARKTFMISW